MPAWFMKGSGPIACSTGSIPATRNFPECPDAAVDFSKRFPGFFGARPGSGCGILRPATLASPPAASTPWTSGVFSRIFPPPPSAFARRQPSHRNQPGQSKSTSLEKTENMEILFAVPFVLFAGLLREARALAWIHVHDGTGPSRPGRLPRDGGRVHGPAGETVRPARPVLPAPPG